jgi:hypothetical protein
VIRHTNMFDRWEKQESKHNYYICRKRRDLAADSNRPTMLKCILKRKRGVKVWTALI